MKNFSPDKISCYLDKKHSDIYVKMWKDCNNKCEFCNQRLLPAVNKFEEGFILPSKDAIIKEIDALEHFIRNSFIDDACIDFMGGELFHRADFPELFEGFEYAAKVIKQHIVENTKHFDFCVFTNLLYEDLSLLKHFLKCLDTKLNVGDTYTKISIHTSFDFSGRFTEKSKVDLFVKNIKELYDLGIECRVKCVLHKKMFRNLNFDDYVFKRFNEIKHLFFSCRFKPFKSTFLDSAGQSDKSKEFSIFLDPNNEEFIDLYSNLKKFKKWVFTPYKNNKIDENLFVFFPFTYKKDLMHVKEKFFESLTNNQTSENIDANDINLCDTKEFNDSPKITDDKIYSALNKSLSEFDFYIINGKRLKLVKNSFILNEDNEVVFK